jgi:thiol-disulfide isomerase/thioredoxin
VILVAHVTDMISNPGPTPARLAAVLALLLQVGCGSPPAHPAVGRGLGPLPIAAVADPDATPPALAGKVTLLNFWGTWCPPCRRELPGLVRLAERLADEPRFQLVAVSCNPGPDDFDEVAAETRQFLAAQGLALRAWAFADPLGREMVFSTIGLDAFPTTVLVGPDATVRRVWVGYRPHDEAEIAAAIVALLKEQPAAR